MREKDDFQIGRFGRKPKINSPRRWPRRLVLRYALLQVPDILLVVVVIMLIDHWLTAIPTWLILTVVGLAILKDILLFPFVWRAYDWSGADDPSSMVGRKGVVVGRIDPVGYVRVRGELWRAEIAAGAPPLAEGRSVTVLGVSGLTLHVERDSADAA